MLKTLPRYILTTLTVGIIVLASACKSNNPTEEDKQIIVDYKYLNAAEIRENKSEAERAEYASYSWRIEREQGSAFPKNFRTCLDEFKEQKQHKGYNPDYVPSRQGLNELKVSAAIKRTAM